MNNIKDIPKSVKKDVIIQEKNNLKKFGKSLIDLKKEIINREKIFNYYKIIAIHWKIILIKKI